jgi:carbohydrate kinase (thermoresistant glucokinase family)
MPSVPSLRSIYAKTGRLVYFGRMLDKIRLHATGKLPSEYQKNLSIGFDARCCTFLGLDYAAIKERTLAGGDDLEILAWCHERGGARTDDLCNLWNRFMLKIGWRDDRSAVLRQRLQEMRLTGKPIETFFDLIEFDEGRDPIATRAWELRDPVVILVMGVSGSGKTTIGRQLAQALHWEFADADDFHPPSNIAKMSVGTPLNDDDRAPWLAAIRAQIDRTLARSESVVVTCSALKESYRRTLIGDSARVRLVYLKGSFELLLERLKQRKGHFMKPEMLQSQRAALEPPEHALTIDITGSPEEIVTQIRRGLSL